MFVLFIAFMLTGCSKPGEHFLGTWSNEWTNGRLLISVERAGDGFLVRTSVIDTGGVIEASSARFDDGYLVLNEGKLFKKIGFSERDGTLLLMDSPLPLPPFRRPAERISPSPTPDTSARSDQNARDAAGGITTFFQENKQNCDIKTESWCAQSMEATGDGFKLHGRTSRPISEVTLNDQLLVVPCYLLKKANAKLPAVLIIEVKDERNSATRYAGTCKQS